MIDRLVAAAEPGAVPLPGRLASPLHFPEPPSCAWMLVWLLLVAALVGWLGWLLWRKLRQRRRATARARPAPTPRRRPQPGIAGTIATILKRHLDRRTYREGCHELSEALRFHWEERGLATSKGARLSRMTAREIRARVGERPATRLLDLLSELQFGRRDPSRKDFVGACELAGEVVSGRRAR